MTTDTNPQDFYLAEFQKMEQGLNGVATSPFHAVRKQALSQFQEIGFPSQEQEEWKYTNTRVFRNSPFKQVSSPARLELTKEQVREQYAPYSDLTLLTFVDGFFSESLSDEFPTGVKLGTIQAELHKQDSELVELLCTHFAKTADTNEHGFIALNTALVQDGALLTVEANQEIAKPICTIFLSSGSEENLASYPRLLLKLEKGAKAEVIEAYHALKDVAYVTNSVSEILLDQEARLEHSRLVFENSAALHVSKLALVQKSNSHFQSSVFNFGGSTIRNDISATLDGEYIESRLNGLNIGSKNQRVDNSTVIDHAKPNSESFELYKGIYADKSQGAFSGTIIVRPDAQKTNAEQSSKSLLLSDTAGANARPQLKIWADDVKCTHGATVGELDEEGLFYLRSRGIRQEEAKNLLIHAFASDVIKEVKSPELREYLENKLMQKLVELGKTEAE